MKGYVYVMSNRAMPGPVKVGFTTGTPDERAAQLNGTHSPHPVEVEYSVYVLDVRAVEHEAHLRLRKHREGKEWFRCSRELAISMVKRAAGDAAQLEFSRVEQEQQRAAYEELAHQRQQEERRVRTEEGRKAGMRREIEKRYAARMALGTGPSFWPVWAWSCVASWLLIACIPNATFSGGLFAGALLGFFVAFAAKGLLDERAAKSPAYLAAAAERQSELDAIDQSSLPLQGSTGRPPPAGQSPAQERAGFPSPRIVLGYAIAPPTTPKAHDSSPQQSAKERAATLKQSDKLP